MSAEQMTPDSPITDAEQIKFVQKALKSLGYSDKEPTGVMDASWNEALKKYKSESNLPADTVLDVKTFASVAKAYGFRIMRNGAIAIGAGLLVGVGGYYAYKHYKKSAAQAELSSLSSHPYYGSFPMLVSGEDEDDIPLPNY